MLPAGTRPADRFGELLELLRAEYDKGVHSSSLLQQAEYQARLDQQSAEMQAAVQDLRRSFAKQLEEERRLWSTENARLRAKLAEHGLTVDGVESEHSKRAAGSVLADASVAGKRHRSDPTVHGPAGVFGDDGAAHGTAATGLLPAAPAGISGDPLASLRRMMPSGGGGGGGGSGVGSSSGAPAAVPPSLPLQPPSALTGMPPLAVPTMPATTLPALSAGGMAPPAALPGPAVGGGSGSVNGSSVNGSSVHGGGGGTGALGPGGGSTDAWGSGAALPAAAAAGAAAESTGRPARPDWAVTPNPSVAPRVHIDLTGTVTHNSVVCSVRFSADGERLATGSLNQATVYDATTLQPVAAFRVGAGADPTAAANAPGTPDVYVRSVSFDPHGRVLAAGAEDRRVHLWSVEERAPLGVLEGHQSEIYAVEHSPDGRLIASGGGDAVVRLWSPESRQCVLQLGGAEIGPKDGVTSIVFSPDGRLIAAGSLDKIVRVWDAHTGYFLERFEGHTDSVYAVAFSPDSRSLVSGSLDRSIRVWDVIERRSQRTACRCTLTGHKDYVLSVVYSRDDRWIISGSKDRSIQFWDLRSCHTHLLLQGHRNSVIALAVAPAGAPRFASGSGDCTARVWQYTNV